MSNETIWQLFRNGPTWDGNLISKYERDTLFQNGLVASMQGWNWLTSAGIAKALELNFNRKKETETKSPDSSSTFIAAEIREAVEWEIETAYQQGRAGEYIDPGPATRAARALSFWGT